MRAAPAFQVSLRRFGVWQGAVLALAGLAIAATLAWLLTGEHPIEPFAWAASALSVLAVAALAGSAVRVPAATLRWDGRGWHHGSGAGEPTMGDLSVAIDLGRWMLLRFTPTAPAGAPLVWLPVQRMGLEPHWHALRCTVHSPRPAPGDDAAGGV
jgi:hypothetical protein